MSAIRKTIKIMVANKMCEVRTNVNAIRRKINRGKYSIDLAKT